MDDVTTNVTQQKPNNNKYYTSFFLDINRYRCGILSFDMISPILAVTELYL